MPRPAVEHSQFSITVLGLVQLARGHASSALTSESLFANPLSGAAGALAQAGPSEVARALYSGLWAFDGWNQANYVGGEMRDAQRNIPRAIHCSMGAVIVSPPPLMSCLLSTGTDPVLPCESLVFRRPGEGAHRSGAKWRTHRRISQATLARSNTVALDFGRALFGPVGGVAFALMVAISCFGALNGASPSLHVPRHPRSCVRASRVGVHVVAPHLRGGQGGMAACTLWAAPPSPADTA